MDTDFKDIMSKRTDEELIKIVTVDRNGYQPLAVIAAEEEIKNRNIDTTKIEQVENGFKTEIEEKELLGGKTVNSLIRFVHFIIDIVIWWIIVYILAIILDTILGLSIPKESQSLLVYSIIFLSFFCYYYIMEVTCQKTVAKFITKTKVVTKNGSKPTKSDILVRTFCRLIPFDQISFLFTRKGFHDRLSDTQVIKDEKIER